MISITIRVPKCCDVNIISYRPEAVETYPEVVNLNLAFLDAAVSIQAPGFEDLIRFGKTIANEARKAQASEMASLQADFDRLMARRDKTMEAIAAEGLAAMGDKHA